MGAGRLAVVTVLAILAAGCAESLEGAVYEPVPEPDLTLASVDEPGTPASQILENVSIEHESLRIPTHDGLELAADVWIPKTGAPVPVVLVLSPYFGDVKLEIAENVPLAGTDYFDWLFELVYRGYAVALVDARGTRESDGCIELGGPNEQQDAATVVEWLASQPWSNGKVGMLGMEYDGWTQLMAAARQAPHLAAIVPVAPFADWYHVVGKGGAKYATASDRAMRHSAVNGLGVDPSAPATLVPADPTNPFDASDPRYQRADDQGCAAQAQAWSNDVSGSYNDWMKARDLRALAPTATAAMLYVHGFADQRSLPDHIDPWYNAYGGPKHALLGPWRNMLPDEPNTGRAEWWWPTALAWFDHHLMGMQNGVNATYGIVEVQDSLGRWRNETAWPPADAVALELPLAPGVLGLAGTGTASWTDDPFEDGGEIGDQTTTPRRASTSRLAFVSAPLLEDLHTSGRPAVRVLVESDRANTLVVARLYEVLADGSWVLIDRGVKSLAHREGLDAPSPWQPGAQYEIVVEMQPGEHVFRAGRSIGLVISSSDASYVVTSGTGATNTIHYDGGASALVLPVIERDAFVDVTWGPAQPHWLGPNAWEASG